MPETLRERAHRWMRENPEAMAHFRGFARTMLERARHFGMKQLAERVRWEMDLRGAAEPFRINNSFVAYVGRQLVHEMPGLRGLVRCRVTKAADRPARASVVAAEVDPLTEAVLP